MILRHYKKVSWPGPDFSRESRPENLKLAKLWSSKALLSLFDEKPPFFCRVFNAHKSETTDRQIGDRRFANGGELHPNGPSFALPSGATICQMHCPKGHVLIGSASDRRDFYHQAAVTRERAFTNCLPFEFDKNCFAGDHTLDELEYQTKRSTSRASHGDDLSIQGSKNMKSKASGVFAGFRSLFQGDHLGVEFALVSHGNLLKRGGLLVEDSEVVRHAPFPQGPLWEGLIIDDFFVVSQEKICSAPLSSASVACLVRAEELYLKHRKNGSDDKTVRGELKFKVIGAEVNSEPKATDAGVVTVGAPISKRISLATLFLRIARLGIVTRSLATRLAGNWVSVLLFRRNLGCILDNLFTLGNKDLTAASEVVPLGGKVKDELVLASIFSLVSVTDVSARYHSRVYATDTSMGRGTIVSTEVSEFLAKTVWLGGNKKEARQPSSCCLEMPRFCR